MRAQVLEPAYPDAGAASRSFAAPPDPQHVLSPELETLGGIRTGEDLVRLREHGINIALVGENLMREPDPGAALAAMLEMVDGPDRSGPPAS